MATENCNTYQLSSTEAASLRIPQINYQRGIVPSTTIAACVNKKTIRKHPQLRADTPLVDVLALMS